MEACFLRIIHVPRQRMSLLVMQTTMDISQFILLPLSLAFVICFSSDTGYSSVPHSIEEIQPMSLANEGKKVKRRRILEREKEIYCLRK